MSDHLEKFLLLCLQEVSLCHYILFRINVKALAFYHAIPILSFTALQHLGHLKSSLKTKHAIPESIISYLNSSWDIISIMPLVSSYTS